MKLLIKKFDLLIMALVIVFAATVMFGCQNKETKKIETKTSTMPADNNMEKKETLPPLDTDSNSTTKPETIKNQ